MATRSPQLPARALQTIANLLTELAVDGPTAIGVAGRPRCPGEGVPSRGAAPALSLTLWALDGVDVVPELAGFVAPAHWHAFGITAPARSRQPGVDLPGGAVQITVLVDRCGVVASTILGGDGRPLTSRPPSGRVVDACRRTLGLATGTPPCEPALWWALVWLEEILEVALAAGPGRAPDVVRDLLRRPLDDTPRSWSVLRRECAAGSRSVPGVDPVAADWMDDAMFAREALGALVPMSDAIEDLRVLLGASEMDALTRGLLRRLDPR